MTDPVTEGGGPYGQAAAEYWDAGWRGVLPLPARAKKDPPAGFTGGSGGWPSRADLQTWIDNGHAGGNICLRLPDDMIGIDVDAYDGKNGATTLIQLVEKFGPLPATWTSSSRGDGSSIRFYRVPPGLNWPSDLGRASGIEIIRHAHRYAVVWPSVHPEGRVYRWTSPDGIPTLVIPQPGDMTDLPAAWVDGLTAYAAGRGGSGWTDPDLDQLVEHGIPAGANQDDVLRDVVWQLRQQQVSRSVARAAWSAIVLQTTPTRPEDPWTARDFNRHWNGADRKTQDPPPTTAIGDEDEVPKAGPFVDVAVMFAEGLPEPPAPAVLHRADGVALFYAGKVNVLFGDPECGKTWIAYAAVVEALADGKRVAIIDTDHNGAGDILTRLVALGAHQKVLSDLDRFRLTEPEDKTELGEALAALRKWRPDVAVVDSIGEILPMLGLSSNSPDDYTAANRAVLTALARAGAAVIGVDHLPKSDDARAHGQTGTLAKRRTVSGVSLRVTLTEVFAPGRGGASSLVIHKDRPGGLRRRSPVDGKYQPAGRFVLFDDVDGRIVWQVTEPKLGDVNGDQVSDADIAEIDAMDPPPAGYRVVMDTLGWTKTRAMRGMKAWRAKCE